MSPLERYGRQIREINRLESQLSMPFFRLACEKRQKLHQRVQKECGTDWRAAWNEVWRAIQEG